MKKKVLRLLRKSFVKNVIIIATGAAGAQLISMFLSPIITRMYGPEAYGIMGSFSAMVRIIGPIATLTYPLAIVLPETNKEAKDLVRLSLIITAIITSLSFFILVAFNKNIIDIFNITDISSFLFLTPVVIAFSGLKQVTEQWTIRTKQFSVNARATVVQSLITNFGKVGIGLFYPVAIALVAFTAAAEGIKASLMIFFSKSINRVRKTPHTQEEQTRVSKGAKFVATKYKDFPLYRSPEKFINEISQGVPILLLTTFFGPASAGFYSIGRTVLTLPSRLIGKAVGDVFYPRIAEASNNDENMSHLIKKATLALIGIGTVPFGLVILFGPTLFSFVFGSDWIVAGEYARWLSLWASFSFISRPSSRSLAVLKAQRLHLIFTITSLVLTISGLAIGYYFFSSDVISVALFGIASAISKLLLIMVTLKLSKKRQQLV